MSVNKNIFIVFIILFLVFVPHTINAFTVTSGDKIIAGSGDWKSWARKKYDSSGNLLICSQPNKTVPTECDGTIKTLDDEVAAGLSVIVNSKINYVCQQLLIDKFLYNYYDSTGRVNRSIVQSISQNKKNWVTSCTNAKTVYDNAIAKKEEVEAVYDQTLTYSASSLDFTYNSSTGQYESTVTASGVTDYECSVDNGATVSYPSYYEVKVSVSSNNVSNTTTLTCKPRIDIYKPTYYDCGTDVQDLITSSMSYEYTYGSPQQISGKRSGSLTINYHSNYATEAFSGALNPVGGDRDVIVGQWIVYSNTQFPTGGDSLHNYKKYNDVYPSMYLARTGYNATGFWNTKADGTGISIDQTRDFATPQELASAFGKDISASDQVVDVYAQWTPINYKVIYHGNGGYTADNHTIVTDSINFDEWYDVQSGDLFDRTDYTFLGWTINSDGTPDSDNIYKSMWYPGWGGNWVYVNGQFGISNNELHLYARWQDSCVYDFINKYNNNPTISDRLAMYKEYHRGAWNSESRRNLLNFEIIDAETACGNYLPDNHGYLACLTSSQVRAHIEYNHSNLSNFNDTISGDGNSISYCLTDFDLEFTSYDNGKFHSPVNAGQMVLDLDKDEIVATGEITKKCYILESEKNNYNYDHTDLSEENDFIKISDYIGRTELDEKEINFNPNRKLNNNEYFIELKNATTFENNCESAGNSNNKLCLIRGSIKIKYKPNAVYAEKITGKPTTNCLDENGSLKSTCRLLGYGVASKFNDALESNAAMNAGIKGYWSAFSFTIQNGTKNIFTFDENNDCKYLVEPEIIEYTGNKGKLQLEFRTIDTNKPFNRYPKTNWSGTNIVQEEIIDSNNSYNKTGGGSLYQTNGTGKIILTPDIVQSIREYNKSNSYNDYTVHIKTDADGTQTTTTDFFEYIGLTKVTQ